MAKSGHVPGEVETAVRLGIRPWIARKELNTSNFIWGLLFLFLTLLNLYSPGEWSVVHFEAHRWGETSLRLHILEMEEPELNPGISLTSVQTLNQVAFAP